MSAQRFVTEPGENEARHQAMDASTPSPIERELTRRGLLVGAGAGALGVSALAQAVGWLAGAEEAGAQVALAPDDPAVRATMAALADTIVPGPAGGADAQPGALEAGALDELYDPFYGASGAYPLLHQDVQQATPRVLGRSARFDLALPYADRERVVLDRITAGGSGGNSTLYLIYQGAAIIVYVAYMGTARSAVGPHYIGFPPASDGYWPGHSYRVRFRGMTKDGNPS
jgi:hypothetical protein